MSQKDKGRTLRAIWREKMHVEPSALRLSSLRIQHRFEHIWQPAEDWMDALQAFPLGLLEFWRQSEGGHLVFTHERTAYFPERRPWRNRALESVCYLELADLVENKPRALVAQVHLFDHLLGSGAVAGGPWLSDGEGLGDALTEVAGRYQQVYGLAYAAEELGAKSAREYLAYGLVSYLEEPRRLNMADPLLYNLYHTTIMSESFWRRI